MMPLILLLVILEFFEAYWQRADTLEDMLAKGYHYYSRSIFLLIAMHPAYFYMLLIALAYGVFGWPMVLALALKGVDILVKINLIQRHFVTQDTDDELRMVLHAKIPSWYYLIGVMTYPYLLYLAFAL